MEEKYRMGEMQEQGRSHQVEWDSVSEHFLQDLSQIDMEKG